jgi:hypothetical protein
VLLNRYAYYSGKKIQKIIWAGLVSHMGAGEVRTDFWWGDLIARDLGVDVKIKWIISNLDGEVWILLFWLKVRTGDRRL